jgi:hypothetical protein
MLKKWAVQIIKPLLIAFVAQALDLPKEKRADIIEHLHVDPQAVDETLTYIRVHLTEEIEGWKP